MTSARMELKVTGLAGDVICVVNISHLERVSDLKEEICRISKISPKLQKLLLGEAILQNNDRLKEVLHPEVAEIQLIRFDKWSEEVSRDWKRLRKASVAVRNDRDLVMACMDASGGEAIKFAGEDVRADREIMLAAMKFDRSLCRYARGDLHTDRAFLLAALDAPWSRTPRFSGWLRWQTSPELCADYDFLLKILAKDGASFRVVQEDLRSNPSLATVAIQNHPAAFRFAGDALRGDPTVAGLAARLDVLNLEFVADHLRADRAFVLEALEAEPVRHERTLGGYSNSILKHLPLELRSDLEVVSKALAYISPYFLSKELGYVSNELRNHPEIRKLHPLGWPWGGPYRGNAEPVRCRPATKGKKTTRDEGEEMSQLHLSQEARNYLMHADDATQHLPSFWSQLIKIDPMALGSLSEDARRKRPLVIAAVKNCGLALQYASAELKEDREVVKLALKESKCGRWAYDSIPEVLRVDREIALLAFRLHRMKLPKQLLNDKDAVVAAAEIAARRAENPGELSRKKLNRMSIANLIAEYELA